MPTSANQRIKLIYLMQILQERTDDEHMLTIQELLDALSEYGITAERKSIYTDLKALRQFGLDIESRKSKAVGYFVASRQFELAELKLLVDSVESSRFITAKKSSELIRKLSSLTSSFQAIQLNRQVLTVGRHKTINESIYYNIDAIHSAINTGKKISFKYFDYDMSKARTYRKSGKLYIQTPLALCRSDDKYYAICYSAKYDSFVHFRVDRMSSSSVSEEPADNVDKKRFNVAEHIKHVFGMYSGDVIRAKLSFDNTLINAVLDRFGSDVRLYRHGNCFEVNVEISGSPVFLSWIAQFGNKAEIISPVGLRESMCNLLDELCSK